jgi:DNA-binding NtrC family response regulator
MEFDAAPAVLLVDDEPAMLAGGRATLRSAGVEKVLTCDDSREVPTLLTEEEIAVVVLDLNMPHLPGEELLPLIRQEYPFVAVIILTGTDELATAVRCMKSGAFDYLVKPVEGSRLAGSVRSALEIASLRREVSSLRQSLLASEVRNEEAFAPIRTRSEKMLAIFRYVEAVAPSGQPILICGETGVGKELVARAVHAASGVAGEFVDINVAGLDDTMFSDTLFGHRKGAFTGAEREREGLVARAAGGTLFLDEIGELSHSSQVKLLRLIQERTFYPLGADLPKKADARIVVATHRGAQALIEEGKFRKDLFYRLSTHQITIPPLRERMEDLPLLLEQFLVQSGSFLGRKVPAVPPELTVLLATYSFPGNVRELENMVFDAVAQHRGGVLSLESFRKAIGAAPVHSGEETPPGKRGEELRGLFPDPFPTLKEAEQFLIDEAMERAKGNQGVAARLLGISRQALNKRLIRAQTPR